MRVTVIRRSGRGDTGRNSATRVERGAGDARRSGVTHAGAEHAPRGRRRWAMKLWRAPATRRGRYGQPTRRRNTVGGSRLVVTASARDLHES
ncbi:hypothetical protein EVAR_56705_1 [Eumeta japonica]|uniref:Uncharacterized protein n=1 Tax=Eumeta variegata TaxID=151549 RepID=A0A4C1XZ65_EUMVA|nr:hypothetical protein EVAR_56705_1 [Eumeta japonica]